jgi:O-antigen ligase
MVAEALAFAWFFMHLLGYYNSLSDGHARLPLVFGRAALFICIGFLIGMFADPDTFFRKTHEGEVARLGGIIINPNELGMLAVLLGVMAYSELLDKRPKALNLLALAVSMAVVFFTQSRSSLLAFLLVTAIFVLRSGRLRLMLFFAVAVAAAMPFVFYAVFLKQGDVAEVMSLTGRLPFWKDLLAEGFTQRPLFGYGFMCIADGEYFHSVHSYAAQMTHNTFAQVLLNLGLVGFFICLLQMVATFFTIGKEAANNHGALAGWMLVPLLFNSFTEFGIFGESNYGIQFYQMLVLLFVVKTGPATSARPHVFQLTKMAAA